MATDDIGKLLNAGIAAAKAGNKVEARRLLEQVLQVDDNNESAWMWFASVVDTPRERRICLENVLEINPNNERARQALEKLKPTTGPLSAAASSAAASALPPPPSGPRPSAASAPPRPGVEQWRPAERRRRRGRMSPTTLIAGIVLALLLIGFGVFLLVNTPSAPLPPLPTPTLPGAVVAGKATATFPVVTLSGTQQANLPPTWTPPPSSTPLPTLTPTATLPPLSGYTLMFVAERRDPKQPSIYTMKAEGGSEQPLVKGETRAVDLAVAASGKLAYVADVDGKDQIVVANADGSQPQAITKLSAKHVASPAWSPDGSKLAFVADTTGNDEIYIINADGSGTVQITDNKVEDRDPAWSPDGAKLIYASDPTGKKSLQLFVYDLQSKKATQITDSTGDSFSPVWSPDGKLIAFVSTRDRYQDVYVMEPNGFNPRLLTFADGEASNRDPSWSPDGKYIVFASNRGGDVFNLFTMTPDGKNVKQITNQKTNSYRPRFRPNQL